LFFLYAHQIDPMLVPALIISDPEEGYFAMEYLDGYKMWKKELLIGEFGAGRASQAAIILAKIHVAGRENTSLERQFDSHPNFFELRLDPYLLSTAKRHKDLKDVLTKEATRLAGWRETVVHGDFSPKNIMIRDERMVLLDHEVAHFGDPAFDVAFMLCHLFLKSLLHPDRLPDWRKMIYEFWEQYFHMATAGRPDDLQARSQHLTLLLLLARVDGKSPVEYLHEKSKEHDFIRSFVYQQMGKRQPFEQTLEDWTLALQSENPD
ncbi:MAG: phosphotransferase, partial [Saprospiraceae bacterium]|nr:phosphotransferase [Saprospiraceae bacterium]